MSASSVKPLNVQLPAITLILFALCVGIFCYLAQWMSYEGLLQDIRRSAYVYRVDCGGCNACEIEIFAAITPVFDAERFSAFLVMNSHGLTPKEYKNFLYGKLLPFLLRKIRYNAQTVMHSIMMTFASAPICTFT